MESALLHGEVFNIEFIRKELEKQNISRDEIIKNLDSNYRNFSKKHSFTCLCCNSPVNMNLTKDEKRPFYFKHMDGRECAYSENTKSYEKQQSTHEDKRKKDVGLTVFREILEGQLKSLGVTIERGYQYKKKLSFIPDFILSFPNSNQVWAIDYYTSIAQGLISGSYARYLAKRIETYNKEGFKVYSFIDESWLALDRRTDKGTLLSAEIQITRKDQEDIIWDSFLHEEISKDDVQFLKDYAGNASLTIDTKSISYVNINNRTCHIIRFLESSKIDKNVTFFTLSEPTIPLERALALNPQQNGFLLFQENENKMRQEFKNQLLKKRVEVEQLIKEEELEREKVEEQLKRKVELFKQKEHQIQNIDAKAWDISETEGSLKTDDEIDLEMQHIMREASERPIDMSPEQWEWAKKTGRMPVVNTTKKSIIPSNTLDENLMKKRMKLKEKLLSHPIKGETYILVNTQTWRKLILRWIKKNQREEELNVSIHKLINDMKNEGISFGANENFVKYPIKEFLSFYQREYKKEMNKKLKINFFD